MLNETEIRQLSPDMARLHEFVQGQIKQSIGTLRSSSDLRTIQRSQAELDLIDKIFAKFFHPKNEQQHNENRLRITPTRS